MAFLEKWSGQDRENLPYFFLWFLILPFATLAQLWKELDGTPAENPASFSCTPGRSSRTGMEYPLHYCGGGGALGVHEVLGENCCQPPLWLLCDSKLEGRDFYSRKGVAAGFYPQQRISKEFTAAELLLAQQSIWYLKATGLILSWSVRHPLFQTERLIPCQPGSSCWSQWIQHPDTAVHSAGRQPFTSFWLSGFSTGLTCWSGCESETKPELLNKERQSCAVRSGQPLDRKPSR